MLYVSSWADDSKIQSIGLKIGYRKYTYKSEYENESFITSTRLDDNYLINGSLKLNIGNEIFFMPSVELWKTRSKPCFNINFDIAYSPYNINAFDYYVGFGLGFERTSNFIRDGYENKNPKLINLNMFYGGDIKLLRNIYGTIEFRFYPVKFNDIDLCGPIVFQAGLSYDIERTKNENKHNNVAKYIFHSLFDIGLLFRFTYLIVQYIAPYD